MKEIRISSLTEGKKLDRMLESCLGGAGRNFIYRMLRKKNITLNGKKASGHETLKAGDVIRIWFSDETFEKFASPEENSPSKIGSWPRTDLDVLYEDEHVLIVNKPVGMLTQKAESSDVSLNEYAVGYLLDNGSITEETLKQVRPSVCNRLDRNTGGIVCIGKTIRGLTVLNAMFRERCVHKYYHCLVPGRVEDEMRLEGRLRRDASSNISVVGGTDDEGMDIKTIVRPLRIWTDPFGSEVSLLETLLVTGRTHQIRAQLSAAGFPLVGDPKYGDQKVNRLYRKQYNVNSQLLHCVRLDFPDPETYPPISQLPGISGKSVTCLEGETFRIVIDDLDQRNS